MSLVKSSATIGVYTLVSRVLGFVRDVTIASSLGASFLSDAFFVAFKLPNFLRRLFAEGAFNSAFIPMFSGALAADGKDKAKQFASEAMSFLLLILIIVTLVCIVAMPWLMVVLAPGFSDDPTKYNLTVLLTRITMPYIIFISMVSLLGGVLNSSNKFAAVAATPILMNLCLILLPQFIDGFTPTGAHALAIAVFVAGIVQWVWLVYFCKKEGLLPKFVRPRLTPDVKKLLILIAPVALGAGAAQINLFIDLIIASQFDRGVSYLYYADRINELPLAVIGIAVGTALLPMLSRLVREGNNEAIYHAQNRAIEFTFSLALPSAIAIIALAEPIIHVLFERGAFGADATLATYRALIAFALGLPAFVLVKVLTPCFYAHQDTKTPFKIALFCILVNLVFNLILMVPLQHVGMALATSISGWVNVSILFFILKKRGWIRPTKKLGLQLGKMHVACGVMLVAVYSALPYAQQFMSGMELLRFLALGGVVAAGAAAYLAVAYILDIMQIRARLKGIFVRDI